MLRYVYEYFWPKTLLYYCTFVISSLTVLSVVESAYDRSPSLPGRGDAEGVRGAVANGTAC